MVLPPGWRRNGEPGVASQLAADTVRLAEFFALPAAIAVGFAQKKEQFDTALSSRTIIGQAIGLVMAEYSLDSDEAFAYIRRVASDTNTKVRKVADTIVEQANTEAQAATVRSKQLTQPPS